MLASNSGSTPVPGPVGVGKYFEGTAFAESGACFSVDVSSVSASTVLPPAYFLMLSKPAIINLVPSYRSRHHYLVYC